MKYTEKDRIDKEAKGMKKKSLRKKICVLLVFLTVLILPLHGEDGFFLGFYPELSLKSSETASIGGGALLGYDFLSNFGAGLKVTYARSFDPPDPFNSLELLGFVRYYLNNGVFFQAEAGYLAAFRAENESFFSGGGAVGWRLFLGDTGFFVEPAIRGGYPYLVGASISVGYKFLNGFPNRESSVSQNNRTQSSAAQTSVTQSAAVQSTPAQSTAAQTSPVQSAPVQSVAARTPESILAEMGISYAAYQGRNDLLLLGIPPVYYFAPNLPRPTGLASETINANNNSIRQVADLMGRLNNNMIIEGHANPTMPLAERAVEENTLNRLSRDRADWVIEQLAGLGVARNRLEARGVGASRGDPRVTSLNADNAWLNRRVEFILVK